MKVIIRTWPFLFALLTALLLIALVILLNEKLPMMAIVVGVITSVGVALYIARQQALISAARTQLKQQAIELENLAGKVQALTCTDDLTQLANRRYFDELLESEWNRARREKRSLTLILLDVDCFSAFNDHYGHDAGDRCLQEVALCLRSCFTRSGDVIARYAAEEFAALLPGTELTDNSLVDRCRQVVIDQQIANAASSVADFVTISVGGCSLNPSDTLAPADLLKTADQALQRAKAEGRNRAVVFDFARGPGAGVNLG